MWLYFLLLAVLFVALGKAADVVVRGAKRITHDYGIPAVFSGLVLGFFTSAPEFFIAMNSMVRRVGEVSYGNLFGGVIVLFCLVAPLNIILNHGIIIRRDLRDRDLAMIILVLLIPVSVSLDAFIAVWEGYFMFGSYVALVYLMYYRDFKHKHIMPRWVAGSGKTIFSVALGMLMVLLFSHFIVSVAQVTITAYQLPLFLFGLLVFGFGTNLPEIMVTLRSWKNKTRDLALGNIIGSAVTNVLILGIITSVRVLPLTGGWSLYFLLFFFSISCILFMFFALSNSRFSLREGMILLGLYGVFFIGELLTHQYL